MNSCGDDTIPVEPIFDCNAQFPLSSALHSLGDDLVGIGNDTGKILVFDRIYLEDLIKQIKQGATGNFSGIIQIEKSSERHYILFLVHCPDRQIEITAPEVKHFLEDARKGAFDKVLQDAAA